MARWVEMSAETIGSALLKRRQQLGLDKGQAADQIGMSRTTYSSYELDKQRPSADVFPALASFLQVSIEDFLPLYGATAVVAVRPALERVLLEQQGAPTQVPASAPAHDHVELEPSMDLDSSTPIDEGRTGTMGMLEDEDELIVDDFGEADQEVPVPEDVDEDEDDFEIDDNSSGVFRAEPDVSKVVSMIFGSREDQRSASGPEKAKNKSKDKSKDKKKKKSVKK